MGKLPLALACWDYDRTQALMRGIVQPEGIELTYVPLGMPESFFGMLRHGCRMDTTAGQKKKEPRTASLGGRGRRGRGRLMIWTMGWGLVRRANAYGLLIHT